MKKFYTILFSLLSLNGFSQDYLSGKVIDNNDNPLLRAEVSVYDRNDNILTTRYTDENGEFNTNLEIQSVTSIPQDLIREESLSLIYPNPSAGGPLHFQYHSANGKKPVIHIYSLQGKI